MSLALLIVSARLQDPVQRDQRSMLDNPANLLALVHDACDLFVAQPFDKAQDEYLLLRFGQMGSLASPGTIHSRG